MPAVSFIVARCVCCGYTWIAGRYPVTPETLAAIRCPDCDADIRHIALPPGVDAVRDAAIARVSAND